MTGHTATALRVVGGVRRARARRNPRSAMPREHRVIGSRGRRRARRVLRAVQVSPVPATRIPSLNNSLVPAAFSNELSRTPRAAERCPRRSDDRSRRAPIPTAQMAPLKHEDRSPRGAQRRRRPGALAIRPTTRDGGRKPTTTNRDDDADGDGRLPATSRVASGCLTGTSTPPHRRTWSGTCSRAPGPGRGRPRRRPGDCCTDAFRQLES